MADEISPDDLQTTRPSGTPTFTVRPQAKTLSRDDAERLVRKYNPDITKGAVSGEVDNIMRESSGNAANDTGDGRTSGGLYQHHLGRLTGLKAFAEKHGKEWTDPEIQVQYSRLEKERDYPALLKLQQTTDDRGKNEDAFKRIFERPASVLWQHNASGEPVLGNDRYRYSDYAMKEHGGRGDTDVRYMSPAEYLDLAPPIEKPFETASGRALLKSVDQGDKVESIPTLDVQVDGPTATVTDQDGRHRAMMAQKEGLEAIPVAVRKTGEGDPKEIVGMNGNLQAFDYPKAKRPAAGTKQDPEQPKEPISLMGRIGEAIIPRAEAAEANPYAAYAPPAAQAEPNNPYAEYAPPGGEQPASGGAEQGFLGGVQAAARGAAKGLGETVLAGQELVGKGMEAVGIPGGQWLTDDARQGVRNLEAATAPDRAAHPIAAGAGGILGEMAVPIGAQAGAVRLGVNALRSAAAAGGLGGLLTPSDGDDHFWRDKALGTGVGAVAGAGAERAGNVLARVIAPALKPNVDLLVKEGVQLTPGQVAGGRAKRLEDAAASIPIIGAQVRKAQERSFETFNRAVINRGLDDIGAKLPNGLDSGHDAIGWAQKAFSDAYDQVIPRMVGRLDNGMQNDLNAVYARAQAANLPQAKLDELLHAINTEIIDPFRLNRGGLSGKDAQKIGTRLDELINPMRRGGVYDQQLGRFLREADKALDDMMERQNPILAAAKDKIDKGYAQFKIAQSAASGVGTRADGTFTPAQFNRAVQSRDKSKDKAAFARGIALMQDLSTAAKDVLPQKVPDSGTPERAALMGILGGGYHFIEPHTFAGLAAASVPYTAPVSRAMNAALGKLAQMPPPGPGRNALMDMARMGGRALAPAAGSGAAAVAPQFFPRPQTQQ